MAWEMDGREREREVSLADMLEARERRVRRQEELRGRYPGLAMVCFTMNVAGPVKNGPLIRRGFLHGCAQIRRQLMRVRAKAAREVLYDEWTGCEGYFMVGLPAREAKRLACEVEDQDPIGRLFDMDVLDAEGRKLDRTDLGHAPRACLICGRPARACARSRAHTVAQLRDRTERMLEDFFRVHDLRTIARDACRALLYEVCTTPKPGLVDRANTGSHRDMDIFTFMDSAAALQPYFYRCGEIGMDNRDRAPEETFALVREAGMEAERAMFGVTRGVNTHKGAIFSMGIACAALGRLDHAAWSDPASVLAACGALARGITGRDYRSLGRPASSHPHAAAAPGGASPTDETSAEDKTGLSGAAEAAGGSALAEGASPTVKKELTAGERLFLQYGIRGVRGQAEDGFPAVLHAGLPALNRELAAGADINRAGTVAMLAILCAATDTNLIARGGMRAQRGVKARAEALLRECPSPARDRIEELDRELIAQNLSPGGTADLLGLCYLLHFLQETY